MAWRTLYQLPCSLPLGLPLLQFSPHSLCSSLEGPPPPWSVPGTLLFNTGTLGCCPFCLEFSAPRWSAWLLPWPPSRLCSDHTWKADTDVEFDVQESYGGKRVKNRREGTGAGEEGFRCSTDQHLQRWRKWEDWVGYTSNCRAALRKSSPGHWDPEKKDLFLGASHVGQKFWDFCPLPYSAVGLELLKAVSPLHSLEQFILKGDLKAYLKGSTRPNYPM